MQFKETMIYSFCVSLAPNTKLGIIADIEETFNEWMITWLYGYKTQKINLYSNVSVICCCVTILQPT